MGVTGSRERSTKAAAEVAAGRGVVTVRSAEKSTGSPSNGADALQVSMEPLLGLGVLTTDSSSSMWRWDAMQLALDRKREFCRETMLQHQEEQEDPSRPLSEMPPIGREYLDPAPALHLLASTRRGIYTSHPQAIVDKQRTLTVECTKIGAVASKTMGNAVLGVQDMRRFARQAQGAGTLARDLEEVCEAVDALMALARRLNDALPESERLPEFQAGVPLPPN